MIEVMGSSLKVTHSGDKNLPVSVINKWSVGITFSAFPFCC